MAAIARTLMILSLLFLSSPLFAAPAAAQIGAVIRPRLPLHGVAGAAAMDDGETPAPFGTITHIVQSGDSAWDIAERYGMDLAQLYDLNGIDAETVLYVGTQLLVMPARTPTAAPVFAVPSTPIPPAPTEPHSAVPTITLAVLPTARPTRTPRPAVVPVTGSMNSLTHGLAIVGMVISTVLILVCTVYCVCNKRWKV